MWSLHLGMLARFAIGALLLLSAACSAPAERDSATTESEDALRASLPRGHFHIARKPSSGSYIADLTIQANKKFELEYVRVTTRQEPWAFNPWLTVPVAHEQSMLLRGTYFTYAGDRGTMVSFDFSEGSLDHVSFSIEVDGDTLRLQGIGDPAFELVKGEAEERESDTRVVSCKGRDWTATFTFDDPERRRAEMKVKRLTGADRSDPPNGTTTIVYDGDTGVDDAMGFSGADSAGGRYELAFRRSELDRTSGAISNVGLGYARPDADYYLHNTLTCTIATR